MWKLDIDESRLTKKKGDYFTGKATALADSVLYPRTQEYKRHLSGTMRPLAGDDLFRIPKTTDYYGMRKYDGEFALVAFDGKKAITINPGGTIRVGLPFLEEVEKLLKKAKVKSCLLAAEVYLTGTPKKHYRIGHVITILRNPESVAQLKKLGLAVFDIVELDGKPVAKAADVFKLLQKWFGKGEFVHPAEHKVLKDLDAVEDLFQKWVAKEGSEGLVVRHDQAGWFKLKTRHNLDVAIIGYSEGSDDRKGMLHDLLVAVMRADGTFHEFARVGGGFTDEDRRKLVEEFRKRIVPSDYVAVNNDYVAYEMIEPGPVIELSCLDIISENSKGDPINKMVLEWDGKKYSALARMPLGSVISPQFVRIRDDKEANVEDVNLRQLAAFVEIQETEKSAFENVMKPSELIERAVYTKTMRGRRMVRKLLLWKTNKEETEEYPGFVVYLTDFSPNRQKPLEREIKVSNTKSTARKLFDKMAEKNFLSGWEKVS
jgi:ATP-dependent DNA ligase